MSKIRSKYLKNLLVADEMLLKRFVGNTFKAAARVTKACSYRSLLVEIPIAHPLQDFAADVEIRLGDAAQFLRMKKAFAQGRVHFEIRRLWSAPDAGADARRIFERDEYGDIPEAIFGFVGTYCGLCICRHSTLDCVTVQIC